MKETRVGYVTTSILEELCKELVKISWDKKDYVELVEYSDKYIALKSYNMEKNDKFR